MRKFFNKTEQRGTLLVEAIAMLGLIALVTPTLYKKSAERLQEIQDINSASQARTMNDVIETLVSTHFLEIMLETSSESESTIKIAYDDDSSGASGEYFYKGYSSFLPYGYKPDSIRNYGTPQIYVHRDGNTLVSYIVYPYKVDPGKKRAARIASLVGANGGIITDRKEAQGTGGAWFLDSSMVEDLGISNSILTENSLIVTANEPIENSTEDNDKYLYRTPPDDPRDAFHNTMITDLYMGGHEETNDGYKGFEGFYGIYNVRKLMMHSQCNREQQFSTNFNSSMCTPDIADLYIGKPHYNEEPDSENARRYRNNGAAWIYGNLTALNEGFKITGSGSSTAEMIFKPTYGDGSTAVEGLYDIVYATGDVSGTNAEVKLIGEFVSAQKEGTTHTFMVAGSADDSSSTDPMFLGVAEGEQHSIKVGSKQGSNVYIAEKGGSVYINASDDSSSSMIHSDTHINSGGGLLYMGPDEGGWLTAGGSDHDSSYVNILKEGGSLFTVGETDAEQAMIYADFGGSSGTGSSTVSLHGKRFQVFADNHGMSSGVSAGGASANGLTAVDGFTAVTTKFTDILGSTYLGSEAMTDVSENHGDGVYSRGGWTLGVAGSAWVDQTLWARKAWLRDAGMANLHAGYKNMADFTAHPKTAWLNVYGESSGVGGGRVVIRDPNKITTENQDSYGDGLDVMFLASSGVAVLSDTEGAWVQLDHGVTHVGSLYNNFRADASDSTGVSGSSYIMGGVGVNMYTYDISASSKVDIQNGALKLYGHNLAGVENRIEANASKFGIKTSSTVYDEVEDSQFYADADVVRTRYVDFEVQKGSNSSTVFGVYPDAVANSSANVEIDGSLHVTGNDIIHIASGSHNTAKEDSSRAMFEIDPDYVRVLAKDSAGQFISNGDDNFALLTIASHDTQGSSLVDEMADTSIYIRRGAIELEKSNSSAVGGRVEADAGYGYIKANRLVSNADMVVPDVGGTAADARYDQYMVNPAYTSVMHDIKLTTRGNARLSDILPDYVLKGVYNVSNDYVEGGGRRVAVNENQEWADPYLGNIYFPMCPPKYVGLATVVPISFQIGKAGHAMPVDSANHKWQIIEGDKQANILKAAASTNGGLVYPTMEEVKSLNWNAIYQSSDTFSQFVATNDFKLEGWFWGLTAESDEYGSAKASLSWSGTDNVGKYTDMDGSSYTVAEPLYFQEGTFLKTSLKPKDDKYWEARMGFIYNTRFWDGLGSGIDGTDNILSNNTQNGGGNPTGGAVLSGYVWNLFPVVTNTLEGHATVYCYFKRSEFDPQHVLQYNPEATGYSNIDKATVSSGSEYLQRLDDPTLKYNEIW
ncbi:MAG: hypothetical protein IJZ30_00305 [Alphaproteobacteria bacterium]|nr:hypothetical protein [Alphaproteobacteria bacterium]